VGEHIQSARAWTLYSLRTSSVGKRSVIPDSEDEIAKLSLGELNNAIAACEWRANYRAHSHQLRKASFKRLIWLEAQREKLHSFAAPPRRPLRARI
jgi:hypothetical protein